MSPEERAQIKTELVNELKHANEQFHSKAVADWKNELREAIDKDTLKKEIIDEVATKESRFYAFLKHPVTLLFLGFIFTTLFGTIVTTWWKYSEWENEQDYIKTQTQCERERQTRSEEIKQKYDVKDEIIRRIAETNTAAEEILLYFQMEPGRRKRLEEERTKYWQEATRAWRINEKILRQRLLLRFENPKVNQLFEELTTYRGWVGININNQQERLSTKGTPCSQIVNQAYLCMGHVTEDMMPQVISIMNEEIWADEKNLRAAKCTMSSRSEIPNASPTTAFPGAASPTPSALTTSATEKAKSELNACQELQQVAHICDQDNKKRSTSNKSRRVKHHGRERSENRLHASRNS